MLSIIIVLALAQFPININCENSDDQKYFVVKHNNALDLSSSDFNESNFMPYNIKSDPYGYQCFIPNIIDDTEAMINYEITSDELEKEKDHAIEIIKNFNFNSRGYSVYKETGYWRYMLRFDHDIHQYHRDITEKGAGDLFDYKLAAWSDNDNSISFDSIPYYKAKSYKDPYSIKSDFEMFNLEDGTKYVSQRIGNGEVCDLTGLPRSTTINYYCNDKQETPSIRNVHEWRTCEYVIDLESNEFCKHSMWKTPNKLINNIIDCFPTKSFDGLNEELIDLQHAKLDPLTDGIFLARHGDSSTFSALLTKHYDFWCDSPEEANSNFEQLLMDISVGFQRYIKNRKLKILLDDKSLQFNLHTPFEIIFKLYDADRSYIGNIKLEQDENRFIVSSFVDEEVPENNILGITLSEEFHEDINLNKKELSSEEKVLLGKIETETEAEAEAEADKNDITTNVKEL